MSRILTSQYQRAINYMNIFFPNITLALSIDVLPLRYIKELRYNPDSKALVNDPINHALLWLKSPLTRDGKVFN